MKSYQKICEAITRGDVLHLLVLKIFSLFGYSNSEIRILEHRNKMFNIVQRRYEKYVIAEDSSTTNITKTNEDKHIWIIWLQGFDKAPEIVRACAKSVIHHMEGWTVHFLDESSIFDYITLPSYVVEKWKMGVIGAAHFTDIVRTELLVQYGGIYMDASVFLSGQIPHYVLESSFFMYTYPIQYDTRNITENWLIKAEPGNKILAAIKNALYAYWEKENTAKEYFIYNLFAFIAIKKYPEQYQKMIRIPANICWQLGGCEYEKFNEKSWRAITEISPVHKLYRVAKAKDYDDKSYLNYIIGLYS